MNGGVLHAVELLTAEDLIDAESGYRYYGLGAAASLLSRARTILETGIDLEFHERQLDRQYANIIPDDSALLERFERHLEANGAEYAPLRARDKE
jgi:hypothetical protein